MSTISISAFPVAGAPATGTVTTGQPAAQTGATTNGTGATPAPEGECQCEQMFHAAYNRYRITQILTMIFWALIILLILKAIFS